MDLYAQDSRSKRSRKRPRGVGGTPPQPGGSRALGRERVGEALGAWQGREVRIARGFAECRGLSTERLEDLYQETALALLTRPYASEEHLRNALRHGIKQRALNLHRDERRHAQILAQSAPSLQRVAESRASQGDPEPAALLDQDRLIVREFLTELSPIEQSVFWLIAEGKRYRAIAPELAIPVNEARKASRSCERKRERFQLLYDTGRLCGYRAATIRALQSGELTSAELARRAFAHLERCRRCRAEHKTNAQRLRRAFQGQAASLLPLPALLGRLGWLWHPWRGASIHAQRVLERWMSPGSGTGGARERAATLIAGGGAGAKLTAGVVTVAVIAGGAVGATHALQHPATRAHHHSAGAPARIPTGSVEIHPLPDANAGVQLAWPHRSTTLAPGSARAVGRRDPGAGENPAVKAAEREFALAGMRSAAAGTRPPAAHAVVAGREAAQREFGIEPGGR
jgi:RNA polymerase sigma factor (sigma-70 family)